MQGLILHTQKVKDEDLIVYILSPKELIKVYRFYGLGYSSILNGYKIDFASDKSPSFSSRLKDVLHLGFVWTMDHEKMLIQQESIRFLHHHLKDVQILESFYFELLDECVRRFEKQNPKRVIVDAYLKILEFEGRPHQESRCSVRDESIENPITLIRAFLPSYHTCALGYAFEKQKLKNFYESKNYAIFGDEEIGNLYQLIKEGL